MLPSGVNFFRQSKAADNQVGGWFCLFCVNSVKYYDESDREAGSN